MEQLCGLEKELSQVSNTTDEEEWDRLVKQAEAVKVSCMLLLYISGPACNLNHLKSGVLPPLEKNLLFL